MYRYIFEQNRKRESFEVYTEDEAREALRELYGADADDWELIAVEDPQQ